MREICVILDTNFLMIPETHNVDIFKELDRILDKKYELVVPEVVIGELNHLKEEGSASEKRAANIALQIADKAKRISSKKSADEEIINLAQEKKCVVGTNDKRLKKRLRKKGIPVIYLRQKSHLDIKGVI
ncbi:hypothetical protein AKJ50_00975 [candidate division MSBL1 archaeon SCGC-AAA382A13]|uniref:PIN domain-containing protein n=2 Tax=candidate division MSBL1 TaxID=215777 RepID=A0A133VFR3_9EURY|nr:hypothetical protein AKJ49_01085 [candidate division MSBL1 archaeon SCGC-AAA382A03]KXB05442.1 hypothetical protein AKJ50_00975 [candidate division MSBL1 archaeon SCGC-AAA382A13]